MGDTYTDEHEQRMRLIHADREMLRDYNLITVMFPTFDAELVSERVLEMRRRNSTTLSRFRGTTG